jgi:hypothetical protein
VQWVFGCLGVVVLAVIIATLSTWSEVRRAARRNPAPPGLTGGQKVNHAVHSWNAEEQVRKQAKEEAWQAKRARRRRNGLCEWCGSPRHSSERHWTATR